MTLCSTAECASVSVLVGIPLHSLQDVPTGILGQEIRSLYMTLPLGTLAEEM